MSSDDPSGWPAQPGYPQQYPAQPGYPQQQYPAPQAYPQQQYPAPQDYPPPGPPAQPYPAAGPPAGPAPGRRRTLMAGVGGFALAALVAVALCLTGVMPVRASSGGVDTTAIELPSRVGEFVRVQDAGPGHEPREKQLLTRRVKTDRKTADALSAAYDGAAAAVQTYAGETHLAFAVWAVRASSPGLVVVYTDAKDMGLAAPLHEVAHFGAVQCIVDHTELVPAGEEPEPGTARLCQRTADVLTVSIHPSDEMNGKPERLAHVLNQVWAELT